LPLLLLFAYPELFEIRSMELLSLLGSVPEAHGPVTSEPWVLVVSWECW
jgi:hypothetical protein